MIDTIAKIILKDDKAIEIRGLLTVDGFGVPTMQIFFLYSVFQPHWNCETYTYTCNDKHEMGWFLKE